jgi:hypothetical protein
MDLKISQQDTDIGNDMSLLLLEMHDLLLNNRQQLDLTCMKEKIDKVLVWIKSADSGSDMAEYTLEHEGLDMLRYIRDCLKLTGRGYMVFQNESSTIAPPKEPDPQTFFIARDRLVEIIDTVLQIKIRNNENEVLSE